MQSVSFRDYSTGSELKTLTVEEEIGVLVLVPSNWLHPL